MKYCLFTSISILLSMQVMAQKSSYASFNHIAIYVKDLKKSVDFYSRVFKFDTIPDPFPGRAITWFKIGEHSQLHIIQSTRDTIIPQETYHFSFRVDNIHAFVSRLQQMQVPYTGADGKTSTLIPRSDGKLQVWFKDPDGYMVEVNDDTY